MQKKRRGHTSWLLDLGGLKGYCNWEIYTQRNKKEKEREVYTLHVVVPAGEQDAVISLLSVTLLPPLQHNNTEIKRANKQTT